MIGSVGFSSDPLLVVIVGVLLGAVVGVFGWFLLRLIGQFDRNFDHITGELTGIRTAQSELRSYHVMVEARLRRLERSKPQAWVGLGYPFDDGNARETSSENGSDS